MYLQKKIGGKFEKKVMMVGIGLNDHTETFQIVRKKMGLKYRRKKSFLNNVGIGIIFVK